MKTLEVLGVKVDAVSAPEAVVTVREGIDEGKRQQVVTVNNEMIMRAQHDLRFKEIINAAALRVPDSAGVVWAAKYLHQPLRGPFKGVRVYSQAFLNLVWLLVWPSRVRTTIKETVPGSDLVVDLAGMCEEFGYRLFLLGAADGVAEQAGRELRDRFPSLRIVGATPGEPGEKHDPAMRKAIKESGAQVVLVAYGAPKQERWIARNLPKLPKPMLAVGVGGSFDYLAGQTSVDGGRPAKTPPAFIRRRGLEWLWRFITQPSRFRRIVIAFPVFVAHAVRFKRDAHRQS